MNPFDGLDDEQKRIVMHRFAKRTKAEAAKPQEDDNEEMESEAERREREIDAALDWMLEHH